MNLDLHDFLASLKNVKGNGNQYTALCPAHDDKQNSLSVSTGDRGILLKCHAGCTPERVIQAMGLRMMDIFNEDKPETPAASKRTIAAVYDYTDLNGNVIFSSVRYSPKSFSQRRPDPERPGQWIYNLQGITPVIYNLPAVLEAVKGKKPVFIMEGEKDADNLMKAGLTATTNPMGAGKWREDYAEYLVDAVCFIVPDNDEPGKRHALSVAKSLTGKAKVIKLCDLKKELPSLPEHGDITDFFNMLDKAERAARFNSLLRNAVDFSSLNDGTPEGWKQETFTSKRPQTKVCDARPTSDGYAPVTDNPEASARLVCMADIQPREIGWLWNPYIPLGKITLLRGDPGQGKTTFCLTLAAIISNGWAFPTDSGFTASEPGNVLFISCEDDLDDTIAPRLMKAKADMKRVFSFDESSTEKMTFTSPQFEGLIKESSPRLVIVDPVQGFLGSDVDGHRANEIRPVMTHLRSLAAKYNCAVVLIEHLNKCAGIKSLYRGLGSIDVTAAARSILMLGSDPDNEKDKGVAHIKYNLSEPGKVIGFTITNNGLIWNPHTTLTADAIQGYVKSSSSDKTDNALDEAKEFLKEVLDDGKQNSKDIHITAQQYGISKATLKRARDELLIDCTERSGFGKDTVVYWKLPYNAKLIKSAEKVTPDEQVKIISLFGSSSEAQTPTDT